MEFDRKQLMDNISTLIKQKGMKIGEIEGAVQISAGYLSKMTKSDNESMPGVDLIYKIAMQLGVSVDSLIVGDFSKASNNVLYLCRFLHQLTQDTEFAVLEWNKENRASFEMVEKGKKGHVLFEPIEIPENAELSELTEEEISNIRSQKCYHSMFTDDYKMQVDDDCFRVRLNAGPEILLMCLKANDGIGIFRVYEMYIMVDGGITPLCNTLGRGEELAPYIKDLYNCIKRHDEDIKITDAAKSVIGRYLNDAIDLPFA